MRPCAFRVWKDDCVLSMLRSLVYSNRKSKVTVISGSHEGIWLCSILSSFQIRRGEQSLRLSTVIGEYIRHASDKRLGFSS